MITYKGHYDRLLTPAIAKEFAQMNAFVGERPIRPGRIAELQRKLDDGLFFDPRWATADFEGRKYRVNGQHSSKMLSECNGSFPHGRQVIVDTFTCDTKEELALLFEQFDPASSSRTRLEVVNAHGRVHSSLDDVSPTVMSKAVAGMAYALSNLNASGRSTLSQQSKLIHRHQEFVVWCNPFVSERILCRVGVVAAIFDTYRRNQDASTEFWSLVKDESAPDNKDASRTLARFLRDSIGDGRMGMKQWDQKAYYVKSIHAWNAWRDGVTTQLKYHPNSSSIPSPK